MNKIADFNIHSRAHHNEQHTDRTIISADIHYLIMYYTHTGTCISTTGTYVCRGIKKTIAQLTSLEH